ncbi:TetR/AcrR family transcriptional regulator [Lentzea sp. NPDC060358]|uniref:TetR/AcrR family transcriptional regulator n=1 Tax=Lentzea sp. NPDC060358 TaxID=3347103 RepID=UPI003665E203
MSEQQSSAKPRRLTAKGAATRQRIIEAAADLMHTQGVEFTSVDHVIEASGTGKSQVYHYFADKTELVDAVVQAQVERVLAVQAPFFDDLHSMRGFERWRDAVVAGVRGRKGAHGCQVGSLASELSDSSDSARRGLEAGFDRWEGALRAGLERMRESGELRSEANPAELAAGLLAALQGGYLLSQVRKDARSMEIALDMALARIRADLTGA